MKFSWCYSFTRSSMEWSIDWKLLFSFAKRVMCSILFFESMTLCVTPADACHCFQLNPSLISFFYSRHEQWFKRGNQICSQVSSVYQLYNSSVHWVTVSQLFAHIDKHSKYLQLTTAKRFSNRSFLIDFLLTIFPMFYIWKTHVFYSNLVFKYSLTPTQSSYLINQINKQIKSKKHIEFRWK